MQKITTEHGVKMIVECELITFEFFSSTVWRGVVRQTSTHPCLGPPLGGTITYTSQVLNIDFYKKQFETLNTVYLWK